MLVRNTPFREWVTVYYEPSKITEAKLLELLRKKRCPRAALDRTPGDKLTAMNPVVGPGGIVQLQATLPANRDPLKWKLPDGWQLVGPATGSKGEDGKTYVSVQVPGEAKAASYSLAVSTSNKETTTSAVEVVRRVGK